MAIIAGISPSEGVKVKRLPDALLFFLASLVSPIFHRKLRLLLLD